MSRQQFKPYGENRAAANTTLWPDLTHGYLGSPKDTSTGYTDVGARKYDPSLGRFISADPLLQTTDPAQLGGYTYAGDNPITLSDPTGLSGDTGNGSGHGVRFNPVTGVVLGGGTGNVNNRTDDSDGHSGSGNGNGNTSGGQGGGGLADPTSQVSPHVRVDTTMANAQASTDAYNKVVGKRGPILQYDDKDRDNFEFGYWNQVCFERPDLCAKVLIRDRVSALAVQQYWGPSGIVEDDD